MARQVGYRESEDCKREAAMSFGHFEGRGWRGFHPYAMLSIAAYGIMIAEQCSVRLQQRFNGDQIILPDRLFRF